MKESLLSVLRDRKTGLQQFRAAADKLACIMAEESALERLHEDVVIMPILRAGMVFLPPLLKIYPQARVGFFGIRRDEKTAKPISYYEKLPPIQSSDHIFLADPMIATGGSALYALQRLSALKIKTSQITLMGILASAEGLKLVRTHYPALAICLVAEDPALDAQKFIVPGLGDFGDRYFGT